MDEREPLLKKQKQVDFDDADGKQRLSTIIIDLANEVQSPTDSSSFVKLCFLGAGIGFAIQFIIFQANSVDSVYPFKINNLYFFTALIMMSICGFRSFQAGDDPLRHANVEFLTKVMLVSAPLAIMDNISMFGLLYTTPQVAACIWYTKIIFAASIMSGLEWTLPKNANISTLFSIVLTIVVYFIYNQKTETSENSMALIGMMMILFSMLLASMAEVFSDRYLGESMTDVSMNEQFFWFAACMGPINFLLIGVEGWLYDSFSWYDYIPGNNYTLMTWILLAFWVAFNYLMIYTASYDLNTYIVMAYTANLAQVLLQHALDGFVDFDIIPFLFALIIYANALSYNLAVLEEQRYKRAAAIEHFFQTHGFHYMRKIQQKALTCPEFARAYTMALGETLKHQEEFLEHIQQENLDLEIHYDD